MLPLERADYHKACGSTGRIHVCYALKSSSDHVASALPPWIVDLKVDSFPCKYDDMKWCQIEILIIRHHPIGFEVCVRDI